MGEFAVQLKASLVKNAKVKIRNKRATISELLYPGYFLAILVVLRLVAIKPETWPQQSFPTAPLTQDVNGQSTPPQQARMIVESAMHTVFPNGHVTLLPFANESAIDSYNAFFELQDQGLSSPYSTPSSSSSPSSSSPPGPRLIAAIVFHNLTGTINYAIRMDPSLLPSSSSSLSDPSSCRPQWGGYNATTHTAFDKLTSTTTSCSGNQYLSSYFFALMWGVDQALVAAKTTTPAQISISLTAVTEPTYTQAIGTGSTAFLAMYIPLGLSFFVNFLVQFVVGEKGSGVKDLIEKMGMRQSVFFASWFLTYAIVELAVAIATTAILVFTNLSGNTPVVIVFALVYLFLLAMIAFGFFVAAFFHSARTAGNVAVYGSLIGTLLYLPFSFPSVSQHVAPWVLMVGSLFPGFACSVGFGTIFSLLGGVNGHNPSFSFSDISVAGFLSYTLADAFIMLAVDIFLFSVLAFYFENVIPNQNGARKSPLFIFSGSYWIPRFHSPPNHPHASIPLTSMGGSGGISGYPSPLSSYPPLQDEVPREEEGGEGQVENAIEIRNLSKTFPASKFSGLSHDVTAVDKLSLDIKKGEIFALLGHNGAGKSTLISMLTGESPPSAGKFQILGNEFNTEDGNFDMSHFLSHHVGVCHQKNIFYENLTCFENLMIFAAARGVGEGEARRMALEMLDKFDLNAKSGSFAADLSGGQKRRLCVALAMLSSPPLLVLDEPTTGVDPEARRQMWQILKEFKKDRTIILTTHFMDEADQLAERKAILAGGKIKCVGSSVFLKNRFGLGYTLEVALAAETSPDSEISDLVSQHVPRAEKIERRGQTVTYRLPLHSESQFPALFAHFDRVMASNNEQSTRVISSYGVAVTTLEDVFFAFADGGEGNKTSPASPKRPPPIAWGEGGAAGGGGYGAVEGGGGAVGGVGGLKERTPLLSPDKGSNELPSHRDISSLGSVLALTRAKWKIALRTPLQLYFGLVLPIAFFVLSAFLGKVSIPSSSASDIIFGADSMSSSSSTPPLPFALANAVSQTQVDAMFGALKSSHDEQNPFKEINAKCWNLFPTAPPSSSCSDVDGFSKFLSQNLESGAPDFPTVGVVFEKLDLVNSILTCNLFFVARSPHALPSLLSTLAAAFYSQVGGGGGELIVASSEPFATAEPPPLSFNTGFLLLPLGLLFVPSTFCGDVVRDKQKKLKHLLYVNGLAREKYWLALFLHHLPLFVIPAVALVIVIVAFDVQPLSGGALPVFILIIAEFVVAMIGFAYALSFLFKNPEDVYRIVSIVMQFSSILPGLVIQITQAVGISVNVIRILHVIFTLCLPPYLLEGGLLWIQQLYVSEAPFGGATSSAYLSKPEILITIGVGPLVILLSFFVVWLLDVRSYHQNRSSSKDPSQQQLDLRSHFVEGSDVIQERVAACADTVPTSIVHYIKAANLRKEFDLAVQDKNKPNQKVVAVADVSLTVSPGDCFGLLAPNGGGKTTTISMMCGEFPPDNGSVHIAGHNLSKELSRAFDKMGVCTQTDTLWDDLTVMEHVQLFAAIKGFSPSSSFRACEKLLTSMDLIQFSDKRAKTLSGGNKRKLCVCLAIISSPKVAFLDEPSSGMDVATRRNMWSVLKTKLESHDMCCVLTTHAMEEAEALCNRIGILIKGRVRCVGTKQFLKSKLGSGYRLDLRAPPSQLGEISAAIATMFPGSHLEEEWLGRATFAIPPQMSLTPATMFAEMERRKGELGILEYSLGQTTLEQVYLKIAREQEVEN